MKSVNCIVAIMLLVISSDAVFAADAARVAGDLKVDGLYFSGDPDKTVLTKPADFQFPWTFSDPNVYFGLVSGNVGIGTANPTTKLEVNGAITATSFIGYGGSLTGIAPASHAHDNSYWKITGNSGLGALNLIGTDDMTTLNIGANGFNSLRIVPTAQYISPPYITYYPSPNLIGGHHQNSVTSGVLGAVIGGGGGYYYQSMGGLGSYYGYGYNSVSDIYGVVGGGFNNHSGNYTGTIDDAGWATVGGGSNNRALGSYATVGGGNYNYASGSYATVGGGSGNDAGGRLSAVSGGQGNKSGGDYSWAGGRRAIIRDAAKVGSGTTGDQGTFVWADSQDADFQSTGQNQFLIRAASGVGIDTNAPQAKLDVNSTGATVLQISSNSTGGTWMNIVNSATGGRAWNLIGTGPDNGEGAGKLLIRDNDANAVRMTFDTSGKVGLGTATPGETFSIAGNGATIELGAGVAGKEQNAGKIGYQRFGSNDSLDIVGAGTAGNRRIAFYAEAGASFTGPVTGVSFTPTSSRRFKTNIETIEDALDKVSRLRGVSYDWKQTGRRDIGLIAEEVAQVVPEVVVYEENGTETKGVDYGHLVGLLVEAVKALKAGNDSLKMRLERIEALLAGR